MSRLHRGVVTAIAAVLVVCGLIVVLLSVGSSPHARRLAAAPQLGTDRRPCAGATPLIQSPTGRVDACVAIGSLRLGRHALSLQDALWLSSPPKGDRRPKRSAEVRLNPSSGPPGTVVTLHVRLPDATSAAGRRDVTRLGTDVLGMVAWDGPEGLMLDAAHFRWTSARAFTAEITVPRAPWIERGRRPQVQGLRSGSFPISITCVGDSGGCADVSDGAADFNLRISRRRAWCATAKTCATLSVYPRRVPAGALVRVSGYLPLAEFDDRGNAFLGHYAISRGGARASGLAITRGPRRGSIEHAGPAAFTVIGGPTLRSLGSIRPKHLIASGPTEIAADPADRRIVAWCGTTGIDLSVAGQIRHVSTAGVAAVLGRLHELAVSGAVSPPRCADVMPLSPTTLLAAFAGGLPQYRDMVPPIVYYALETRDGGRTWTSLPVPAGSQSADFGGFRQVGRGAEAIFARAPSRPREAVEAAHPLLERSIHGGESWQAMRLRCPGLGPCVTLGPFLPGVCAMGISTQLVLRSSDADNSWRQAPVLDPQMFACGDAQLGSIATGETLVVNAISPYPLQLSGDDGATWTNVRMPLPARLQAPQQLQDFGPGGITWLPDGALLLTGGGAYRGGWQLLTPGSRHWCTVAGYTGTWQFTPQASRLTVIGADLWWLSYGNTPPHGPTPIHVHTLPLSAVRCA
jgi:hypothetical protein